MRERIFSLESEYGVSFIPSGDSGEPTKETIVAALRGALVAEIGLSDSVFFANGAKFYHDVGHAEWAHPECRSAREIALYDKAADHLMAEVREAAENTLRKDGGYRGKLLIVKNNVDVHGNTYGCHENYMAEKETPWMDHEDYLRLSIRYLVPFLTTRMILCGPGRAGWGRRGEQGMFFQISQRADFINAVVSRDTRDLRGIFNLGRENEPFSEPGYRRLHLILGDACMSGYGTLLKLGTFGIMLRMLEDLQIRDIPYLRHPVSALHTISRDPTCKVLIPLYDGREVTAIDIQRIYYEQARRYFEQYPASPVEAEVMTVWGEVLDALATDPTRLFGKIDWVTKKLVMDRYLDGAGLTWGVSLGKHPGRYKLQEIDIQYHNVNPAEGLFYRLITGKSPSRRLDSLHTNDEIQQAARTPPPFTRANVRGRVITAARRANVKVEVKNWNEVRIEDQKVEMHDPFAYFSPEAYMLLNSGKITPA